MFQRCSGQQIRCGDWQFMPGFHAEMNLPLHGCRTGPGSHFTPLKRHTQHCDSSHGSPESSFTQLMKQEAVAVLLHSHSALIDTVSTLVSACSNTSASP